MILADVGGSITVMYSEATESNYSETEKCYPEITVMAKATQILFLKKILSSHRYQYYLQLKKDILEGNIPCTFEQAIHLAGLAVQGKILSGYYL